MYLSLDRQYLDPSHGGGSFARGYDSVTSLVKLRLHAAIYAPPVCFFEAQHCTRCARLPPTRRPFFLEHIGHEPSFTLTGPAIRHFPTEFCYLLLLTAHSAPGCLFASSAQSWATRGEQLALNPLPHRAENGEGALRSYKADLPAVSHSISLLHDHVARAAPPERDNVSIVEPFTSVSQAALQAAEMRQCLAVKDI